MVKKHLFNFLNFEKQFSILKFVLTIKFEGKRIKHVLSGKNTETSAYYML